MQLADDDEAGEQGVVGDLDVRETRGERRARRLGRRVARCGWCLQARHEVILPCTWPVCISFQRRRMEV
jgi:hypothetical protein